MKLLWLSIVVLTKLI